MIDQRIKYWIVLFLHIKNVFLISINTKIEFEVSLGISHFIQSLCNSHRDMILSGKLLTILIKDLTKMFRRVSPFGIHCQIIIIMII